MALQPGILDSSKTMLQPWWESYLARAVDHVVDDAVDHAVDHANGIDHDIDHAVDHANKPSATSTM